MLITLTDIEKTYTDTRELALPVLKQCSFQIGKGEMAAIVGKSGAGKSTLLHILGLADKFDNGSYVLEGEEITGKSESQLARLRNQYFGYVMQDFALIPYMNVYDNIAVPLYISNKKRKEISKKVFEAADKLGIGTMIDKKVSRLSGGQKQRAAIARALVNDPSIILADEPTGALDSDTGKEIIDIFKNLKNMGKTVILVTHDNESAMACDRVLQMKDGKIKQ